MFAAKKTFSVRSRGFFDPSSLNFESVRSLAASYVNMSHMSAPAPAGALSINSLPIGNYDYVVKQGSQLLSSFTASDWFTSTTDTASAWVIVNGDMTINSGITFRPSVRKLFMVLYVNGNLTVNGVISMTARGANHSGTGNSLGATAAAALRVASGTYSVNTGLTGVTFLNATVADPTVSAAGEAGGTIYIPMARAAGFSASSSSISSGGGGSGYLCGPGSAGTVFTGGSGGGAGGGCEAAGTNGGYGGLFGGVGNPSAANSSNNGGSVDEGTAGTLIVIATGLVLGTGSIQSNGGNTDSDWIAPDPNSNGYAGGAGGGGVVVLMSKTHSGPALQTLGGVSTSDNSGAGGNGGNGAAVSIVLP